MSKFEFHVIFRCYVHYSWFDLFNHLNTVKVHLALGHIKQGSRWISPMGCSWLISALISLHINSSVFAHAASSTQLTSSFPFSKLRYVSSVMLPDRVIRGYFQKYLVIQLCFNYRLVSEFPNLICKFLQARICSLFTGIGPRHTQSQLFICTFG